VLTMISMALSRLDILSHSDASLENLAGSPLTIGANARAPRAFLLKGVYLEPLQILPGLCRLALVSQRLFSLQMHKDVMLDTSLSILMSFSSYGFLPENPWPSRSIACISIPHPLDLYKSRLQPTASYHP